MSTSAIYARKSTESEERQIQSLNDQLVAMRAVALRDGIVPEEFEESKSAKEPGKRPIFAELIEAVKRGEIDTIYTWSINRLSRNEMDGGVLSYLLRIGKIAKVWQR